jgi:hypothetical protein
MKKALKISTVIVFTIALMTSCNDLSQKIEDNIVKLNSKTEKMDSLVNTELEKVNRLDSIINKETEKVKKLDSIIDKSALKIDSIANSKLNLLRKTNK